MAGRGRGGAEASLLGSCLRGLAGWWWARGREGGIFKGSGCWGYLVFGKQHLQHSQTLKYNYCETTKYQSSRTTITPHLSIYTTISRHLAESGYTVSHNPYNFHTMPASAPSTSMQTAETEAFERELAALTAYEDGWDRWDGPVWPVGYEQCRLRKHPL